MRSHQVERHPATLSACEHEKDRTTWELSSSTRAASKVLTEVEAVTLTEVEAVTHTVVGEVAPVVAACEDQVDGVKANRRRQVDGEVKAMVAVDQLDARVTETPY